MTMTHESRITSETPLSAPGVREWLSRQDGWDGDISGGYGGFHLIYTLDNDWPGDKFVLHVTHKTVHLQSYRRPVGLDVTVEAIQPFPHIKTVGQLCLLVEGLTGQKMDVTVDEHRADDG